MMGYSNQYRHLHSLIGHTGHHGGHGRAHSDRPQPSGWRTKHFNSQPLGKILSAYLPEPLSHSLSRALGVPPPIEEEATQPDTETPSGFIPANDRHEAADDREGFGSAFYVKGDGTADEEDKRELQSLWAYAQAGKDGGIEPTAAGSHFITMARMKNHPAVMKQLAEIFGPKVSETYESGGLVYAPGKGAQTVEDYEASNA
jgi:hypothetical protein